LLLSLNVAIEPQSPEDMAKHLADDIKRVGDLVKRIGIKAE
jgi:hypothetical protein